MATTTTILPTEAAMSDTVAALRVAGRFYRFFLSGQVMNANAGRSMRKICGLSIDDAHGSIAAEDEQDDHNGLDAHNPCVVLPSVSRLKWNAVVEAGAFPFDNCANLMKSYRNATARRIKALACQLPVSEWAAAVRGAGELNLGLIIGETGDLSLYANPAKLWKRMGLAVMADGRAHRRVKGEQTGYSPLRRTIMHNLGECLLKLNDGEYRASYDQRKAYELSRDPEMKPIIAHKRALRYMEKRFLRNLWREWQRVTASSRLNTDGVKPDPVAEVEPAQTLGETSTTPSEKRSPAARLSALAQVEQVKANCGEKPKACLPKPARTSTRRQMAKVGMTSKVNVPRASRKRKVAS